MTHQRNVFHPAGAAVPMTIPAVLLEKCLSKILKLFRCRTSENQSGNAAGRGRSHLQSRYRFDVTVAIHTLCAKDHVILPCARVRNGGAALKCFCFNTAEVILIGNRDNCLQEII